jgi:hypothetical protein
LPAVLRDQPVRGRAADRDPDRITDHDDRHDRRTVSFRDILDVQRPGERQHPAQCDSVDETQSEQRGVAVREDEGQREQSKRGSRLDDGGASADAIAEVAEPKAADQRADEPHAEDIAHHDPVEMILSRQVRCGEGDRLRVEAVKERDDPRDHHQPDQKAPEFLLLDDLGNVNHGSFRHSPPSFKFDSRRWVQSALGDFDHAAIGIHLDPIAGRDHRQRVLIQIGDRGRAGDHRTQRYFGGHAGEDHRSRCHTVEPCWK